MLYDEPTAAPPAKRRILIADDRSILREALRTLLESHEGLEVVGMVDRSAEAVRSLEPLRPELVLVDIAMRNMDGLTAIAEIKRHSPATKVLVMTADDTENHIRAALRAGADGYVLKDISPAELLTAIASVFDGMRFISPCVSAHILTAYLKKGSSEARACSLFDTLTPREKQVLKLIAEGKRNREIAMDLVISIKTVEKHRSNLMQKMDLHNIAALTAVAIDKGLLGTSSVDASRVSAA
jgi:DNA-binding NarL/FixJ family response regulator